MGVGFAAVEKACAAKDGAGWGDVRAEDELVRGVVSAPRPGGVEPGAGLSGVDGWAAVTGVGFAAVEKVCAAEEDGRWGDARSG
jgi:hypothetical protein